MLDPLVFDRTHEDTIIARKLKKKLLNGDSLTPEEQAIWDSGRAGLNAAELNRVDDWTRYLAEKMQNLGYSPDVHFVPTEWTDYDIIYQADIDRIRSNVDALHNAGLEIPEWHVITYDKKLTMEQANALEWDLQKCADRLESYVPTFIYSGQSNTASGLNWYFPEVQGG